MYQEYFGLSQPPFRITPDTNLFYSGGNRGAILEALIYAINNGEGIVKVVGEVGTGKTMLCRMLEVELTDNIEVVYLANPSLSPDQIPYAIAFELKLEIVASSNRLQVMNELQNYLLEKHRQNEQVVVFVEEAQSMPLASLEELRLLSNLETGQSKLLQIVLFGQPELDEMIGSTEIRQLKERITYSFQLAPFKTPDIKEYLNARVRACGYRAGELFTSGSIREVTRYSNGLLRRVNILADKALLSAYATGNKQVKAEHVKVAARDSEFVSGWQRLRWPLIATATILMLAISTFFIMDPDLLKNVRLTARPPLDTAVVNNEIDSVTDNIQEDGSHTAFLEAKENPEGRQPEAEQEAEEMEIQEIPDELSLSLKTDASISTNIGDNPTEVIDGPVAGEITVSEPERNDTAVQPSSYAGVKLLALENIIQQQDLGVIQYSEKELSMMLEQLEKIPSESIINDNSAEGACENCASLIYRPLFKKENL